MLFPRSTHASAWDETSTPLMVLANMALQPTGAGVPAAKCSESYNPL
jgi:hypothetical protein